jgi:hypothetical protein
MEILKKYNKEILEAKKRNKTNKELGFNFFSSISDYYYRENFHSDIFKTLLTIPEFFETFFHELSVIKGSSIQFDYHSAIIERERHGRIDISIIDMANKKAIVIENKINDAVDMPRQLPRYYENLSNKGNEVVDIIYLSLSGNKQPSKINDWTELDKKNLENKITIMSAINRDNMLNLDTIISKSLINTNNIDHIVFQKQYKNLINHLASQEINHSIMDELYLKIKTENDLEDLLNLKKLIENLPKYRAIRIREHFKNSPQPFAEVNIYKEITAFFNRLIFNNSNFALDISCFDESYDISFFDRSSETNESAIKLIEQTDLNFKSRDNSQRLHITFKYPSQEKELYEFIEKAKIEIDNVIKSKT